MFLHCHNCNWGQDDFWDLNYGPLPDFKELEEHLFVEDFDAEYIPKDGPFPALTHREYVVDELLRAAKRIWEMRFRNTEEWNRQSCPQCGNKLCID